MFIAKYSITNNILKNIGVIEASREVVVDAPLISAWELKLKKGAFERSIFHGVQMDGSRLAEEETLDILDGREVFASEGEVQEVLNYEKALKYLEEIVEQNSGGRYVFTLETIFEIHKILTEKLVSLENSGNFRARQVVLKNAQTMEVSYTPPPAAEIPFLMEDLVNWLNSEEILNLNPVIKGGIALYEMERIHPFLEENSKFARVLANLILKLDKYDLKGFFCMEEYFDLDPMEYHTTLQSVSNQRVLDTHERDLTLWLNYFVEGVAGDFNKIKEQVKKLSADSQVKDKLGENLELNERQMLIVEFLNRHSKMQNKDFRKIFPDYSDDTVLRELRFLAKRGIVKKMGGTKKATYLLV